MKVWQYLGRSSMVNPGTPRSSVGFSYVVRKIFDAGAGSGHYSLKELEHLRLLASSPKFKTLRNGERERDQQAAKEMNRSICECLLGWRDLIESQTPSPSSFFSFLFDLCRYTKPRFD